MEVYMSSNCVKKFSFKKSFLVLTVVALGLHGMKSFASGNQNHHKMNNSQQNTEMKKGGRKSLSEATKKLVLSVLKTNEHLHNSFFKYDGKLVEENAIKLKNAIESIKEKEITKLLKFSKEKLMEIKAINVRDANNRNYDIVSRALIYIIDNYDIGNSYNSFKCPMAFKTESTPKKQAFWIQNTKKINRVHNPYSPNMPHCGSQDSNH
jgi:hypothetical protein